MSKIYHDGHRQFHDQFDTRRLADRMEEGIVEDKISPEDKEFVERRDMFFIATADESGHVNCSYRGGEPGFIRVVDERTIAFPNYDGNGMYLSMGNVLQTGQVGILFIDFENQYRMRLNGEATIDAEDPLMNDFPGAQFIVRVRAREVFHNCRRYIHKMKLVERSRFIPKRDSKTPVPSWKKGAWLQDALPKNDPALDDSREVLDR